MDDYDDELVDKQIMDNCDVAKDQSNSLAGDDMTPSELENLMDDSIKADFEVATRRIFTKIVKETIEVGFTVSNGEQKGGLENPIKSTVEESLLTVSRRVARKTF